MAPAALARRGRSQGSPGRAAAGIQPAVAQAAEGPKGFAGATPAHPWPRQPWPGGEKGKRCQPPNLEKLGGEVFPYCPYFVDDTFLLFCLADGPASAAAPAGCLAFGLNGRLDAAAISNRAGHRKVPGPARLRPRFTMPGGGRHPADSRARHDGRARGCPCPGAGVADQRATMAKRSQHRASAGQDARSERPATGRGQPRAVCDVAPRRLKTCGHFRQAAATSGRRRPVWKPAATSGNRRPRGDHPTMSPRSVLTCRTTSRMSSAERPASWSVSRSCCTKR